MICTQFDDSTDLPTGWTASNNNTVQISSEHAFSGTNSVKVTGAGSGYNANYLIHDLTSIPELNEVMFGRMMIRLSSENSQGGDFTFIQADGGPRAASGAPEGTSVMYRGRLDGRNDHFMANYDTWFDNGSGSTGWLTDCWAHPNNINPPPQEYLIPKDEWACVQWEFDADANSLKFWLNDNELSQIQVINQGDGCVDSNTQNNVWWGPQSFDNIRLGVEQYHDTARSRIMYIDDIAIDDRYVSCPDSLPPVSSSSSASSVSSATSSSSSVSSVSSAASSSPSSSPNPEVNDLTAYFDQNACGVGYDAIGNGGWPLCYRLEDGTAACVPGTDSANQTSAAPRAVTWGSGAPITNVAHITGNDSIDGVIVVTDDGAAYRGSISNVSQTPVISSGAISATGGYQANSMCIIVENGSGKDLRCGQSLERPNLPADFDVMQVTAAYGFMCALNKQGEIWCWSSGGNVPNLDSIIGSTPAKVDFGEPMVFVSAGQTSVCGTKQSGGISCKFARYDAPFLPAPDGHDSVVETPASFHPNGMAMQSGYRAGLAINNDGSAVYYNNQDGTGTPLSLTNIVAGGGDRGAMGVLTESGDIYLVAGGSATQVQLGQKAQAAQCSR